MKLSNEQLQQLKEETKKSLVEAQKTWIYRLIDFANQENCNLISLNANTGIGTIFPHSWNTLYPEVIEQLKNDGYDVLGNSETDAPFDLVVLKN